MYLLLLEDPIGSEGLLRNEFFGFASFEERQARNSS
jgi:hypothetical protein